MAEQSRLEIPGASTIMLAGKSDDGAEAATCDVLAEVAAERSRQWRAYLYDNEHDDAHRIATWATLITTRVVQAIAPPYTRRTYRNRLIQAAALCVAAIEALDRRLEQEEASWER